jgi:hypothetical protein
MPRTTIDPTIAPETEAHVAHEASRILEAHGSGPKTGLRVQIVEAGREVTTLELPPSAVLLIRSLLKEMGDGKALTLVADDAEIQPSSRPPACLPPLCCRPDREGRVARALGREATTPATEGRPGVQKGHAGQAAENARRACRA